ncbi:MAG: MaoC/PaaZ C-terminal domain-containing protein [Salinisphaera sp.]|jgi:hypothetical protein|nr:MaoC/PaaZ C-terminal domain-containing protein [Salinisphaera sp.]
MSADVRLEYDQLPSLAPSYLRAATTFSSSLSRDKTIPSMVATMCGLDIRAEHLARYRRVCGFARESTLPVTYPHVLAFPLHMAVLTNKQFPLKLLGLIHVRNDITQHRAININESLDLTVLIEGHREVSKGVEFDLITRVADAHGEIIWEGSGAMLSRQSTRSGDSKESGSSVKPRISRSEKVQLDFVPEHETTWSVPADIGRRYAKAAGDYNPIHLSPWSAKLFGFPRAIATGMWTKARVAAELAPHLTQDAYTLALGFKKPVFLPSAPCFKYETDAHGADFALVNDKSDKLHLAGSVRYL